MSDENDKFLSILFRVDNDVIEHNNRSIISKNVVVLGFQITLYTRKLR